MSGIGSTIGGLAGGALGNILLPGIGGAIGSSLGSAIGGSIGKNGSQGESKGSGSPQAGLSSGIGILQNLQANKLKRQADAAMPGFVDPNQSAFLAELAQKRKSIDTGADFAAGMNTIDSTNAGTNDAIVRSTGGDVGGTIQALLQSQGMANQAKNNVLAQGQQQQMQYNQMYGSLLNRVEQRKLEIQMYRSQQARAEWAKKQQQANQNMMAGLGRSAQQSSEQEIGALGSSSDQQGMDWTNPQGMNAEPMTNPSAQTPIMTQGASAPTSVDLSVLNTGNEL
jgi:hypothetical protein